VTKLLRDNRNYYSAENSKDDYDKNVVVHGYFLLSKFKLKPGAEDRRPAAGESKRFSQSHLQAALTRRSHCSEPLMGFEPSIFLVVISRISADIRFRTSQCAEPLPETGRLLA
jgi:hypothetical protein